MAESDNTTLELASAHRLLVERVAGGSEIRVVSPNGSTPITIEVTERGVSLRIDGANIALHATKDLSISAERLVLEGRGEVVLQSGGDLELAAAGDLKSTAQQQIVRAERGSVDVRASDDVKMAGERVLVNCDETVNRYYRKPPA